MGIKQQVKTFINLISAEEISNNEELRKKVNFVNEYFSKTALEKMEGRGWSIYENGSFADQAKSFEGEACNF